MAIFLCGGERQGKMRRGVSFKKKEKRMLSCKSPPLPMLQCKQVIAEDRKKELVEKMANLANSNLLYELSLMMTLDDMAIVYIDIYS